MDIFIYAVSAIAGMALYQTGKAITKRCHYHYLRRKSDKIPGTLSDITFNVQGLNWPATLGDFTLVGPANNQGAWRWYERQHNGTTERVKVDHQLQPLGRTNPPPREP